MMGRWDWRVLGSEASQAMAVKLTKSLSPLSPPEQKNLRECFLSLLPFRLPHQHAQRRTTYQCVC